MLAHLDIRNIVLIDHVSLDFKSGLSVLTGETGAGKSILLDALGLLRGDRADTGLVRKGTEQASVTAAFDIPPRHPVRDILSEQGIVVEDTLLLRRVLSSDGKSRAFINDQSVTVALLRLVGRMLVDLHGQFDTSDLFDPAAHRHFVDDFGGYQTLCADVAQKWRALHAARADLAKAEEDAAMAAREEDYLRDAVQSLTEVDVQAGEEEKLVTRKALIAGRAQIVEGVTQSLDVLQGDDGAEQNLSQAARIIERLRPRVGDDVTASWLGQIDTALGAIRDVTARMDSMLFDDGEGSESLEVIEDRLYTLRGLARRYGCTVDELPQKCDELRAQLRLIDDGSNVIAGLTRAVKLAEQAYLTVAGELSAKRKAAAKKLDQHVMAELPPLKLDKARFETQVTTLDPDRYGADGIDAVRFVVATNPGSLPGPLDKIASGGEISRLMLALKVVLAEKQNAHLCMIFDEVDSGIGGAVAAAVAERLARMAQARQILAVTHAPQVAARADHHFIVAKGGKGNVVNTQVTMLSAANDRREEIARMLSGEQITDEARAAAQKLLGTRVA